MDNNILSTVSYTYSFKLGVCNKLLKIRLKNRTNLKKNYTKIVPQQNN